MNLYYFLYFLSSIFHPYNVFYNCIRQFTETKVWSGDHRELHIDDLCCGLATVPMITCRLCPLIRYRLVERCSAPAACLVSLRRTQTFHWSNNGWRHWRLFGHQQLLRNRGRFRVGGCFRILRERDLPESKIFQTKTKWGRPTTDYLKKFKNFLLYIYF